MKTKTGLYARNSSQQQSKAGTTKSQIEALKAKAKADGNEIRSELIFSDEGVSGSSFERPALERLRDGICAGEVDCLYVHSPDRLARNFAHQMILLEEFKNYGVNVIFLDRPVTDNPEEQLLVQVQGVIAEYERAKILERTRRGRLYAARRGSVSVLSKAPFGYRYINKAEGSGNARFEIEFAQARVVQDMFKWFGEQRMSLGGICTKLEAAGHKTPTGLSKWDRSSVWGILKNPAYKGKAAFGKTKITHNRQRLRPAKGVPSVTKRCRTHNDVDGNEWIFVPVPSLVSESLFDLVQEQLEHNKKARRERIIGAKKNLLGGLLKCGKCGFAYCATSPSNRKYQYYRCSQKASGSKCKNSPVSAQDLEEAVWAEVVALLQNPQRLEDEYNRRLHGTAKSESLANKLKTQKLRVDGSVERLIDAYSDGTISKAQFQPRMAKLQKELANLEKQSQAILEAESNQRQLRLLIVQLTEFRSRTAKKLDKLALEEKRKLVSMLIDHVTIAENNIDIRFRVGPLPFVLAPKGAISPNCLASYGTAPTLDTGITSQS